MGLLQGLGLVFGFMISAAAGLEILLSLEWSGRGTPRKWDLPTAICSLFAGFLFMLAKATFSSIPTGIDSMVQGFRLAAISCLAGGGSLGFGLTAVLGSLLMITARMSRRR
jgi:hypothetical protein